MNMVVFSERLKELRKSKNLSQKELAKILHTTNSSVCDWECGRTEPNLDTVLKIAQFFEISTDFLFGLNDYK